MKKGQFHSDKTKIKLSKIMKKRFKNKKFREILSKKLLGRKRPQHEKDKISNTMKGMKKTKEHLINNGLARRKKFKDLKVGQKHGRIKEKYGSADICDINNKHKSTNFHWANINHKYNENINGWIRTCQRCHIRLDHNLIKKNYITHAISNRKLIIKN